MIQDREMSLKRKRELSTAAQTGQEKKGPDVDVSTETLVQINDALTATTLVQQPLIEGTIFLGCLTNWVQPSNYLTDALPRPIGRRQMKIEMW
jgi:hypothetical protein